MARGRALIRDKGDRERARAFLQIRLDQAVAAQKASASTYGGPHAAAVLKERIDVILSLWGPLLQGTRAATAFSDGGPFAGGETPPSSETD